ncbi:MAG TPA: hypothetical protein VGG26_06205, partial [Terracidiphilus sp.]
MTWQLRLAVFALALGAGSRAGLAQDYAANRAVSHPADSSVVGVDFSDAALSPSHWTLTLHPDGSGHFHSEMGKPPQGDPQAIDAPDIDRDVQLSAGFTAKIFEAAHHHKLFNEDCESHLKVAFQGLKKLSYTGPEGSGSCTFN